MLEQTFCLSVSSQSVCLPLPLVHKSCSRSQRKYRFIFYCFIALHSHEETKRALIPMKDSLACITAEGPNCSIISTSSVINTFTFFFLYLLQKSGGQLSLFLQGFPSEPLCCILNSWRFPAARTLSFSFMWTETQQAATLVSLWTFTFAFSFLLTRSSTVR